MAEMTKRQRQQATKSDMLDALHQVVLGWDPLEDSHGLTAVEYAEVQAELGRQLYDWAVRITPKQPAHSDDLSAQ